ncbi:hypothetical protein J0A67_14890 [Algoriphagus aestuariicola]|uniref:Uncharacterized protein n=1 Tax=Algoriphagus aestuariicola TaxID=1852016 RepID=A0ABS3BS68_9BACT|nr:hypothetical protein [Algoriphagus aestuariicola]MBN7802158.1 hypothetical protein [Algoriphagus aestuariicola]
MKKKKNQPIVEEWDLSEGMGILPNDIGLTQNIGCVGGKNPKTEKQEKNQKK